MSQAARAATSFGPMRILAIRLRLIGDVVFTTPLLPAIKHRFPGSHLTYLVESSAAPVVQGNPHLDRVWVVAKTRGMTRVRDDLALAAAIRAHRFDLVIDLHGGPRGAWLTWASGAATRVGYRTAGRSWMYTVAVPRTPDEAPRHSVQNQWDLLAPLGIAPGSPDSHPVDMPDDVGAASRVARRLDSLGISTDHPLIVIHVSAGNPFRRWPKDSFAALAARLVQTDVRRRIVLTSGPSDQAAAGNVADDARLRLGDLASAIPVLADVDLVELRALVARASVYIGGDSGPLHIAATTRTPIVELLGPTLPERSRPWRRHEWFSETVDAGPLPCRPCRQRTCAPGDFRCLTGVSVDQVVAAVERALRAGTTGATQTSATI